MTPQEREAWAKDVQDVLYIIGDAHTKWLEQITPVFQRLYATMFPTRYERDRQRQRVRKALQRARQSTQRHRRRDYA